MFTKGYNSTSKEPDVQEPIVEPPSTTSARLQMTTNWLSSDITKEVFEDIGKDIETYQNKAIELAVTFPQHQNPQQIINLLVRVDELKNRLKKYGRVN